MTRNAPGILPVSRTQSSDPRLSFLNQAGDEAPATHSRCPFVQRIVCTLAKVKRCRNRPFIEKNSIFILSHILQKKKLSTFITSRRAQVYFYFIGEHTCTYTGGTYTLPGSDKKTFLLSLSLSLPLSLSDFPSCVICPFYLVCGDLADFGCMFR